MLEISQDDVANTLLDGLPPATPEDLRELLDQLGASYNSVSHPPLRTVEDSKTHRDGLTGGFSKNLFLRNKKSQMWLLTCMEDRKIDLKALGQKLGAGRVSFGSPQRLMHYLGVIPGSVTPFAVVNDKQNVVRMVIDAGLLQHKQLNFHPLVNTETITVNKDGLMDFLDFVDHAPEIIDLD